MPSTAVAAPHSVTIDRPLRSRTTLILTTALHAFTHAYWTILLPLYALIVADLKLPGMQMAALIVAIYGLVYCIASYGAGILADRFDRKLILGVGLIGNAAAILMMGLTRQYEMLLVLAVMGGLFGTLFHPSANALVPAHFPRSPGMAIGILGIGAGIGFFAGPQYAGWRAETAGWAWGSIAGWQKPLVEMGLAGIVFGVLFLMLAREASPPASRKVEVHPPLGRRLRWRVIAVACVLGFRDLAGGASGSLASIYLLRALGYDARSTGFVLGTMMLMAIVINPLVVYVSGGRRRLPMLSGILVLGALIIVTVPYWSRQWILPVLCLFQACQLGSYALSDAAMLERVPGEVRGRVVGLFLTIAGTLAAAGPWLMGAWSDSLGARGTTDQLAYVPLFAGVGAMMLIGAFAAPLIARLGLRDEDRGEIDPVTEIRPATLEPAA